MRNQRPNAAAAPSQSAEDDDARTARSGQSTHGSGRRRTHSSRGSYEKDWAELQAKMQQMLGTLEMGHVKPKPIFPQSVLGHLFMRKYGLSRDQRAQVVRATNGSSRFRDIERILRASDLEESRSDDRRASKPVRRDTYAVQKHVYAAESDSSSVDADMLGSADSDASEYALAAENQSSSDEDVKAEIEEVFELQRKAKEKFKKSFKNYKDVKRKVKELKRNRQPYYPVVALNQPPDAGQPSSAAHAQVPLQKSTFRYDKKLQENSLPKVNREIRPSRMSSVKRPTWPRPP